MKHIFTVKLNARQVKEACEAYVERRLDTAVEEAIAEIAHDLEIEVFVRKRQVRKPKTNGVASAGELSDAERRFG